MRGRCAIGIAAIRRAAAVLAIAALAAPALAHRDMVISVDDPVSLRMGLMMHVGAAAKTVGRMAKGQTEYEPRAAEAAFRAMNTAALGFHAQFAGREPPDAPSEASERIWEEPEAFRAAVRAFIEDTAAATKAAAEGEEAFRGAFAAVAGNCKSCHEKFRVKRN